MPQYHWQSICYDPWRTDTTQALFIILSKTIAPKQQGDDNREPCCELGQSEEMQGTNIQVKELFCI